MRSSGTIHATSGLETFGKWQSKPGETQLFSVRVQTLRGQGKEGVFACFEDGMGEESLPVRHQEVSVQLHSASNWTCHPAGYTLTPGGQKVPQPAPAAQGGGMSPHLRPASA